MAAESRRPGDAILFKGSRGTRVEKALEEFLDEISPMLYWLLYQDLSLVYAKQYPSSARCACSATSRSARRSRASPRCFSASASARG